MYFFQFYLKDFYFLDLTFLNLDISIRNVDTLLWMNLGGGCPPHRLGFQGISVRLSLILCPSLKDSLSDC